MRAAEFCWRKANLLFLSNLASSKSFFLSLSFELRPPKSTLFRLEDGSPLKNILSQILTNPRTKPINVLKIGGNWKKGLYKYKYKYKYVYVYVCMYFSLGWEWNPSLFVTWKKQTKPNCFSFPQQHFISLIYINNNYFKVVYYSLYI